MISSVRVLGSSLNYCHIIHNDQYALVIDPGESEPVLDWLALHHLHLTHILITHHHLDHVQGINGLKLNFPNTIVIASSCSQIAHDIKLQHHETFLVNWLNSHITCLHIPGHTIDHCAYLYQNAAFVGDTLFSLGCGQNFEGSFETMLNSINLIKSLNDETMIYFAHEYTKKNLLFTLSLTDSPILEKYLEHIPSKTVPSSLAFEKEHNLFLQCDNPILWKQLSKKLGPISNMLECFTKLRLAKNRF